ncbi:type VI secretion system baseplate subunit TssE [Pseudomonas caspiana]|uniref:Type VI secretion system lysozyme n=1 Tax=Pseudomonas caspiana TaxID=1451454 RepID=A0A1Y3NXX2_9PSED|nr:type VI secretion system baseplate subunit TssE [Pseudomonas caspiana]OUM72428.1 type VI secretion system lysozyme [Pseudomonas caspiana]
MAELTNIERLQPSLLDRLIDEDTQQTHEARDKRVLSKQGLRKAVLRDVGWLLNSTSLSSVQSMEAYPQATHSVLNFGLPDLVGRTVTGLDQAELGRRICQAIWDFEPRILRATVRVVPLKQSEVNPNQLVFEIQGELWGQSLPERLYLKTELDLEGGNVQLFDVDERSVR